MDIPANYEYFDRTSPDSIEELLTDHDGDMISIDHLRDQLKTYDFGFVQMTYETPTSSLLHLTPMLQLRFRIGLQWETRPEFQWESRQESPRPGVHPDSQRESHRESHGIIPRRLCPPIPSLMSYIV